VLNPLPAIALAPLATFQGFLSVPDTLRMIGPNDGPRGVRYVVAILVPAVLPLILAGLKIGWAFARRTLIAAELVFGATSGQGGLGWYIFQSRNERLTDQVFAGLVAVILIGLLLENLLFRTVEAVTVRRWRMLRSPGSARPA
jgi:NitT/TauT family transport system permease protein